MEDGPPPLAQGPPPSFSEAQWRQDTEEEEVESKGAAEVSASGADDAFPLPPDLSENQLRHIGRQLADRLSKAGREELCDLLSNNSPMIVVTLIQRAFTPHVRQIHVVHFPLCLSGHQNSQLLTTGTKKSNGKGNERVFHYA